MNEMQMKHLRDSCHVNQVWVVRTNLRFRGEIVYVDEYSKPRTYFMRDWRTVTHSLYDAFAVERCRLSLMKIRATKSTRSWCEFAPLKELVPCGDGNDFRSPVKRSNGTAFLQNGTRRKFPSIASHGEVFMMLSRPILAISRRTPPPPPALRPPALPFPPNKRCSVTIGMCDQWSNDRKQASSKFI